MASANEPIELADEPFELLDDTRALVGRGKCWFRFLPRPTLSIEGAVTDAPPSLGAGWRRRLRFTRHDATVDVLVRSALQTSDRAAPTGITMIADRAISVGTRGGEAHVSQVVFHLANFHDFWSEVEPRRSARRAELAAGGWHVTLEALPETQDHVKQLSDEGGFAITHVGTLCRTDHGAFSMADGKVILAALYYFLSFARGFWTGPFLYVGIGEAGERLCEEWEAPLIDPWHSVSSWFDRMAGHTLAEIFPGFVELWRDDMWLHPLRQAIYWYVASNTGSRGTDTGIVLTQTALELLSWVHSVESAHLVSRKGFDRLWASDRLRVLLSSLDIPLDVPEELEALAAAAAEQRWQDGPHAFTAVRNSIVHPVRKAGANRSDVLRHTWELGLWYTEMVLLRLCGHSGSYANRLHCPRHSGQVEPVPWAQDEHKGSCKA